MTHEQKAYETRKRKLALILADFKRKTHAMILQPVLPERSMQSLMTKRSERKNHERY